MTTCLKIEISTLNKTDIHIVVTSSIYKERNIVRGVSWIITSISDLITLNKADKKLWWTSNVFILSKTYLHNCPVYFL